MGPETKKSKASDEHVEEAPMEIDLQDDATAFRALPPDDRYSGDFKLKCGMDQLFFKAVLLDKGLY